MSTRVEKDAIRRRCVVKVVKIPNKELKRMKNRIRGTINSKENRERTKVSSLCKWMHQQGISILLNCKEPILSEWFYFILQGVMPRRKCAFAFNNGKLIKQRDLEKVVARKKKGKNLKPLQSLEALKRYFSNLIKSQLIQI